MASKAEYEAGAAAILKIVQADIQKDVPVFFRSSIPASMPAQISADAAKAAIDAAEQVRLSEGKDEAEAKS